MRVRIVHHTRYDYAAPVRFSAHSVRLVPAPRVSEQVVTYNLAIDPEPHVQWQHDQWGNRLVRANWVEGATHQHLDIRVDAVVDLHSVNPFDFFVDERCEHLPWTYPDGLDTELAPFLQPLEKDEAAIVEAWLGDFERTGHTVGTLVKLNARVASDIRYLIRTEPGLQTPAETLKLGSGSCRDSAWLLVAALRHMGLAARFVSGYLIQLEDEGDIPGVPRGMTHDVLDLHAWCEVFIPGGGWIGLDGTSGLLCGEGHIPLSCAVVPAHAAPVTGGIFTLDGKPVESEFTFEMTVERLGHEPRPRKPYTDEQWDALVAAGEVIDRRLESLDIALTTGGEPTWTTREQPELPEWNTEALGFGKWVQGVRFARHVRDRFGAGGLTMHRFGKHYPGESLPRWAIDILWRKDGQPIWRNPARLQLDIPEATGNENRPDHLPTPVTEAQLNQAEALCRQILGELGVKADPIPVFEDPWVAVRTEAELPADVDPRTWELDSDEERRRLARSLMHGLARPTAFVVPVQAQQSRWISAPWRVRRERIYLVPGDSPAGLRLPLRQLSGVPAGEPVVDPSTLKPESPLVVFQSADTRAAAPAAVGSGLMIHTALSVEVREGVLFVFAPPVASLEAFLSFVNAVENAAEELDVQVRLEGYAPPPDPRLERITITPDPGVIEVNIPPAPTIREHAATMAQLQDAARHAGLWCEKFLIDGRAMGTGGGNHITLGGRSTLESPFLQKPELTARLIRFFQHHPSLSYLFSGLFVGPTSQAPRVDEARLESLAELELALMQMERAQSPRPWLVDRLLRNLLVDITGNTHRTEICIDKLFNPGSVTGRLGILELRAFEMPPHERMVVAQVALVRGIVAALASAPYDAPLVKWGARLHDEFMLPYFQWRDFQAVLAFLERRGVPLQQEWFQPFLDYRFPLFGQLDLEGMRLEIRSALEPWPVLGEEPAGGGVSRYVDSSLERLELRVIGGNPTRHALSVNGVDVPTHATDMDGVRVAGLRFRAWQPPHCLQPQIGVHHPLSLDVVDRDTRSSRGGCRYHVWHPEGRAFTDPPLTATEAAARRIIRFTKMNHTPWPVSLQPARPHPDMVYTTDLRWQGV
jgi:uncharacterized protein (DUF2126 family)/transglutaminase-like putative cysteine protease